MVDEYRAIAPPLIPVLLAKDTIPDSMILLL